MQHHFSTYCVIHHNMGQDRWILSIYPVPPLTRLIPLQPAHTQVVQPRAGTMARPPLFFIAPFPLPLASPSPLTPWRPSSSSSVAVHCRARPGWADVLNATPPTELRVGDLAVPRHLWSRRLRRLGVHRSVEYEIEHLELDNQPLHSTSDAPPSRRRDIIASLRPVSALRAHSWPVRARVSDACLWSYKADVFVCAAVCLAMSTAFITGAVAASSLIAVYKIPSRSMLPTIRPGDALLVEKVSLPAARARRGEVVFFTPPAPVRRRVELRRGDLLVKRVVAVGGDVVNVSPDGVVSVNGVKVQRVQVSDEWKEAVMVGEFNVPEGCVFLLGDNGAASFDSRFWGVLPEADVKGRPVARIFPPERTGLWGVASAR